MTPAADHPIGLFLAGDVMTGRGIDQALAHPVDPVLFEAYVRDARAYVRLAEEANGPIPRPVDDAWPDKGINYRMHPRNIGCLTAAGIDACSLANNHVLDWGHAGLAETLRTLDAAGIARAGAGHDAEEAAAPAVIGLPGGGRVLVFSFGSTSSGVPPAWAATASRPGVNLLPDLSEATALRIAASVQQRKGPRDLVVASIHWGPNWGYAIPEAWITFAHRLVEGGVDVVHGHSSHHVMAIDVHRGRLILYGCGDFLDDYEGIGGYETYRPDLRLMYLVRLDPQDGHLVALELVPLVARRFRLVRASLADARWVGDLLGLLGRPFGTSVHGMPDGGLRLDWG